MKLTILIILSILTTSCNFSCNNTAGGTGELKHTPTTDTLTTPDSLAKSAANTYQQFPAADTALHTFFSNLSALEKFINPQYGVYCIEPGLGATPVFEKLKNEQDLLGKTPFLFLCRDVAFIKNSVLVNPASFDPCSDSNEGYVILDVKQPQTFLQNIYQLCQNQAGASVNDSTFNALKQLDGQMFRSVIVNFTEKHGEPISLKLYFYKNKNVVYLGAIDLSDCGA